MLAALLTLMKRQVLTYSVEKLCFQNYEFFICDLLPIRIVDTRR